MDSYLNDMPEPVTLTGKEMVSAKKLRNDLLTNLKTKKKKNTLELANKKEIEFSPTILKIILDMLNQMQQGTAFSLIPIHNELTTQEAADLLNVSRPYLIHLLKEGKIPYRKVGTKRRILAKDVIRYKKAIYKKRYKALEELTKQAQELDMGY